MPTTPSRLARLARRPVRREGAEHYLFLTLVAFAATVLGTRAWLELTGYPRIGGGDLHVAHALFGGFLLVVAAVLPLTLAGRRSHRLAAVLGGIGIGLFIDEVGKFITTTNDYFYPAAAPLIYATFLLGVLLYLRVRHRRRPDARTLLLTSLQLMEEVVDGDMQAHERDDLRTRLARAATQTSDAEQQRLARALLDFLEARELRVVPRDPGPFDPIAAWWRRQGRSWLGGRGLRVGLVIIILVAGARALADLGVAVVDIASVDPGGSPRQFGLELVHLVVEGIAGLMLVAGSLLVMLTRRDLLGVTLTEYGLLISLVLADLTSFYLRQFGSAAVAIIHAGLLYAVIRYRRRLRIAEALQRTAVPPRPSP